MDEIQFYSTISRIINNDTDILILHLIQIFSMIMIGLIILYNMIFNGNLTECGVFKIFRRIKR
jgi:hypothetical protein